MDWDKVRREDMYRRGGSQQVGGAFVTTKKTKKPKAKNKVKGFLARYPGVCMKCRVDFPAGTRIIMFASGKPLHVSCI
jgi:hypothetical protein